MLYVCLFFLQSPRQIVSFAFQGSESHIPGKKEPSLKKAHHFFSICLSKGFLAFMMSQLIQTEILHKIEFGKGFCFHEILGP